MDHVRFESLVAEARATTGPAAAVALFRQAEALWRGPALLDELPPSPPVAVTIENVLELFG